MKKGILCLLLSFLMLAPMFVSCTQTADLTGTKASVYTLYTIVDDRTTDEAINQVELALNRIVFYRLGVILNLEMIRESEYDQVIADKFTEMEELTLAKKNNSKKEESSTEADESEDLLTGDRILDILEEGKDIPMEEPRLDIFLVRGYDKYYELAKSGDLAALDEKLSNEAKSLKSSIHSTLFTAAKVDNKTYGIPVNNQIGEYTYLVFDKALLEKYSVDPNTIKSLADLQGYLETIKANETDVVPLKNTAPSTEINFLGTDGFPAIVSNKEVIESYSNTKLTNYLAMIARYKSLGLIGDEIAEGETDNNKYAVRIESGSIDEINARLGGSDNLSYSLYSNPIATNENTIDNIFCVSKYAVSNELTDIMKIVTAINTDAQLMNLLTFGVENEHYVLNDDGQVERLNENYMIDPNHVGNCFLTYTLAGENPNKWDEAVKQNQDAIVSPALGFTSSLHKFMYSEMVEIEDPNNPGQMIEQKVNSQMTEPDYISIINGVVEQYYPALMNGTAIEIDYNALQLQASNAIKAEFVEQLDKQYEDFVLKPMFAEKYRPQVIASRSEELKEEAANYVLEDCKAEVEKQLVAEATAKFKAEKPDATDAEIEAMLFATVTGELIEESFSKYFSEEDVQKLTDETFNILLDSAVDMKVSEVAETSEYINELNKLKASSKYTNELNQMLQYDAPLKVQSKIDTLIAEKLNEYTAKITDEISKAIQTEMDAFIAENKDILGLTEQEILVQIGYLKETIVENEDDEESDESEAEPEKVYEPTYENWYKFAFETKIKNPYYTIFGKPNS